MENKSLQSKFELLFKDVDKKYGKIIFPILYVSSIIAAIVLFFLSGSIYKGSYKDLSFLIGPLVAGFIAFLTAENNRENEISKLREKWLSELKIKVSGFVANSEYLYRRLRFEATEYAEMNTRKNRISDDYFMAVRGKEINELYADVEKYKNYLFISLKGTGNDEVVLFSNIEGAFNDLRKCFNDCNKKNITDDKFDGFRRKFRDDLKVKIELNSASYFRGEWDRIKRGGVRIRVKRISMFFCIVCSIGFYIGSVWDNTLDETSKKHMRDKVMMCAYDVGQFLLSLKDLQCV